jgi:hypothetical protein
MNIRPDFQSVSEQLTRLLLYSEQANKFNFEDWPHLKNREDFGNIYSPDFDVEARSAFEGIYASGRELAGWMANHFSDFNEVGTFPTLKSYVQSFSNSWVYQIQDLKKQVSEAKDLMRRRGDNPWSVRQMVKLFESEILILEAVAVIVEELKESDLYQRETGVRQTKKSKKFWEHFDAVVGIAGFFSLVFWGLSEEFNSPRQHKIHCFFFSLAVICFLAGGAHLAHKTWKKPRVVWTLWLICCVIFVGLVFRNSNPTSDSSHAEKASVSVENQQTNLTGWLPPELPANCSNVTVFFGNQGFVYSKLLAEISPDAGTKFAIKDLPDFFVKDMDKLTNYSPRKRDMWFKYGMTYNVGGKSFPYPVQPIIVSNRLYVQVEIPFRNDKRKVVMSDDFDSELPIPRLWDRNYSTNPGIYCYEVVNELTNPVLQVFYTAPDEVHVNGIFHVDADSIFASFGADPQLLTASNRIVDLKTNQQRFTTVSLQSSNFSEVLAIHTNDSGDVVGEMLSNEFYRPMFPGQMRVFKYPSNRNPGAFEPWVKIQTNSPSKSKK